MPRKKQPDPPCVLTDNKIKTYITHLSNRRESLEHPHTLLNDIYSIEGDQGWKDPVDVDLLLWNTYLPLK